MSEQIIAWVVLLAGWVFLAGPILFTSGHSKYIDDVKSTAALTAFVCGIAIAVAAIFWALGVFFI